MLGKVLGMVIAGVFIGAAMVEISGYLARHGAGKKPLPPQGDGPGRRRGHNARPSRTTG